MRLKAGIWIKAYIRRLAGEGVMAVVVRHGDDDAGAIFVRVNRLDGTSLLFGPAPAGLDEAQSDRPMMPVLGGRAVTDDEVDAFLERHARSIRMCGSWRWKRATGGIFWTTGSWDRRGKPAHINVSLSPRIKIIECVIWRCSRIAIIRGGSR